MKSLRGLLFSALVVAALISCGGQGSIPGSSPIVNDYRTGARPIVKPESLCIRNPNGPGWICSGRPTRTPIPTPPPYGSQGTCAVGYIYFSDGCEENDLAFAETYPTWTGNTVVAAIRYQINFDTAHYWNRHLACYLTGTATDWTNAAAQVFDNAWQSGNAPAEGAQADYPFQYQGYTTVFRVFNVTQGMVSAYYDVTTAFIPYKPNCPGY